MVPVWQEHNWQNISVKTKISVRAVLCSHGHYDHTENNRFLQEEYGAELVMSCLDAGILQDILSLKTDFLFEYVTG